jgi:hypothetical protein
MSLLLTEASLLEAAITINNNGYFKKLNVTTIKGKTSCKTKKELLNFMVMQVIVIEEIEITIADCDCLREEFDFTQSCEDAE